MKSFPGIQEKKHLLLVLNLNCYIFFFEYEYVNVENLVKIRVKVCGHISTTLIMPILKLYLFQYISKQLAVKQSRIDFLLHFVEHQKRMYRDMKIGLNINR